MIRILIMILVTLPMTMFAQKGGFSPYFEAGLTLGSTNYSGDLSHTSYVGSEANFAGGALIRYNVSEKFAFRANLLFGRISGDDKNSDDEARLFRNLDFFSPITEISIVPEWYILGHDYSAGKVFSPYVYAGVGVALFNPQTELEGTEFELNPLRTEGQLEEYSLSTLVVPLGVGVKYAVSRSFNVGIEFGARWTNSDFLDDVSGQYASFSTPIPGSDTQVLGSNEARALSNRFWENEEALGFFDFLSNPFPSSPEEALLASSDLAKRLHNVGLTAEEVFAAGGGEAQALPQIEGSQRGDDSETDWYNYLGVTLTYNFRKDPNACPSFW